MIQIALLLLGLSASPVDQAVVDTLATTYTFGVAQERRVGCIVELKAAPTRNGHRPVSINRHCRDRFEVLRVVSHWEPTSGGSIRLLGGAPLRELSNFSPVQDASGVYLRGGFEGRTAVYELRPPQ